MNNIKILDCTLRDGGYVNNWDFGCKNIAQIITNLVNAKIDFVECGFFKFGEYKENESLFSQVEQVQKFLPKERVNTKFTLMINYGEYDIDKIPQNINSDIIFRVAFKKKDYFRALEFCKKLKQKGYDIFINPMHTNTYSSKELLDLISQVNEIKPIAFTIVDTTGSMKEKDVLSIFYLVDMNLDKNISLCFHSHNNLQLSFSNAQCVLRVCKNRELIIDSTIFGIGRGAGNLDTELITQYLNDNYNCDYELVPILKTVEEQINPIFVQTPWGYSVPYYLAATNCCHPNYAKYLIDKQIVPIEIVDKMLRIIPNSKKTIFDEELIEQIYSELLSKETNKAIEFYKTNCKNEQIILK